jgi:hypothetical protein
MKDTIRLLLLIFFVFNYAIAKDVKVEKMTNSKLLLEKIKKLAEIPLPDEWYSLSSDLTLADKFHKLAEKEAAFSVDDQPLADRVLAVKVKYCNSDKPFKHTVYFNRLVSVDFQVGSYLVTIVSCKENLYTSLKAVEVLEFDKLGKELSIEKQDQLLKILK